MDELSSAENDSLDLDRFHLLLRSEAELHWQRNNYFSVVASILLLALSQFKVQIAQIVVSMFGLALSGIWLLITHRSDGYIEFWKKEIERLQAKLGRSPMYFVKGLGMTVPIHLIPIAFLLLWALLTGMILTGGLHY